MYYKFISNTGVVKFDDIKINYYFYAFTNRYGYIIGYIL